MLCVKSKLSVLFDDPFWVGIVEIVCNNEMVSSRIVFGAEPKDYEVYEFLLQKGNDVRFSPPVAVDMENASDRKINPKRIQRQIRSQLSQKGVGTKAQLALKLLQEESKIQRLKKSGQQREAEEQMKFELRQEKRKEKHKGR